MTILTDIFLNTILYFIYRILKKERKRIEEEIKRLLKEGGGE